MVEGIAHTSGHPINPSPGFPYGEGDCTSLTVSLEIQRHSAIGGRNVILERPKSAYSVNETHTLPQIPGRISTRTSTKYCGRKRGLVLYINA